MITIRWGQRFCKISLKCNNNNNKKPLWQILIQVKKSIAVMHNQLEVIVVLVTISIRKFMGLLVNWEKKINKEKINLNPILSFISISIILRNMPNIWDHKAVRKLKILGKIKLSITRNVWPWRKCNVWKLNHHLKVWEEKQKNNIKIRVDSNSKVNTTVKTSEWCLKNFVIPSKKI